MQGLKYGSIINWPIKVKIDILTTEEMMIPCTIEKYWEDDKMKDGELNCHKIKLVPYGNFENICYDESLYLSDFMIIIKENPEYIRLR